MKKIIYLFLSGALFVIGCSACKEDTPELVVSDNEKTVPHLHDLTDALGKPLTEDLFFSKGAVLSRNKNVMQWFDIAPSGRIYYAQNNSSAEAVISRAPGPNEPAWHLDLAMQLSYFGHGDTVDVEENADDGKTYVWVHSNATQKNGGKTYWGSLSISRIEFTPGAKYEHCAGETFFFTGHSGIITDIDFDNRRLLVGSFNEDFHFTVFDLDKVLALPYKDITITTIIAGKPFTRTVKGHDLADLEPIDHFGMPYNTPNKETDILSYDHQGHAIYGDYIYLYEGNTVSVPNIAGGYTGKAYLTVFDIHGKICVPRTEVKALNDRDSWINLGICDAGWLEPEGMVARADGIYLGLSTKDADSNIPRKSHILKYQCNLCKK